MFAEAVFRLGQLAFHPGMTNKRLLRRMARTLSRYCDIEVVGVASHESGMEQPASLSHIVGPWSDEQGQGFDDWSRLLVEDANIMAGLRAVRRGRVHRLTDLLEEEGFIKQTRLYSEFLEPMKIVDQAFGVYRRADGCELVVAAMALENTGRFEEEALERFMRLAHYAAKAWAASWRFEPEWVLELKPITQRVLEGVMEGFDDDQIAEKLGITYHAVRAHMKRLFKEAGVRSRLHLMQAYRRERTGGAGAMPGAAKLNGDTDVVTVVDPTDTAGYATHAPVAT
jgi:hypothetical protein